MQLAIQGRAVGLSRATSCYDIESHRIRPTRTRDLVPMFEGDLRGRRLPEPTRGRRRLRLHAGVGRTAAANLPTEYQPRPTRNSSSRARPRVKIPAFIIPGPRLRPTERARSTGPSGAVQLPGRNERQLVQHGPDVTELRGIPGLNYFYLTRGLYRGDRQLRTRWPRPSTRGASRATSTTSGATGGHDVIYDRDLGGIPTSCGSCMSGRTR